MQLILAVLAAAACIGLGMLAAGRLSERERLLNAWEEVLRRLEMHLDSGCDALPPLLRDCTRGTGVCLEKAAEEWERNPVMLPEAWMKTIAWEPLLTPPEADALKQCLEGLLLPQRAQQMQTLLSIRNQWTLFRRISREARENNARLYSSLGWLAGAAVFILIC